jgi:hypothetical protein
MFLIVAHTLSMDFDGPLLLVPVLVGNLETIITEEPAVEAGPQAINVSTYAKFSHRRLPELGDEARQPAAPALDEVFCLFLGRTHVSLPTVGLVHFRANQNSETCREC